MDNKVFEEANACLSATEFELLTFDDKLALFSPEIKKPFFIDFLAGAIRHRRHYGGGKGQMLARACAIKQRPLVLDMTAGLGRDAYVLACLGARVQLVERNPVVYLLLQDAIKRLNAADALPEDQMVLHYADALHSGVIEDINPDVIYLDPMHPERTGTALVKQDMQLLQRLVGADIDKAALLSRALKLALKRVVLKWPLKARYLSALRPSLEYRGKSTRYEVYLIGQ